MENPLRPPVLERHGGIDVVREDLCTADLPSGKLRGLLPWFAELAAAGTRGVVNHAVSYSNSHAIVGYAARHAGLAAVSYVNCRNPTPQTELAARLGVRLVYSGPKQLGPLRAHALRHREDGFRQLPWALSHRAPYEHISRLPALLGIGRDAYDAHVVPIGGGGYAYAIAKGIREQGREDDTVYGVTTSGDLPTNRRRLAAFDPFPHVRLTPRPEGPAATPFPSDPNYEHWAWPVACALRDAGRRVCFWSVGRPLC